jgi:mannose-6-phosphate isomerase-like protein (cupin superfamily)
VPRTAALVRNSYSMDVRARDRAEPFTTKDGSTIRELMHAANQSLAEATLAPGEETQRHYHAASEELYYVLAGEGEMEVDGERSAVFPGDAILIPPGARHQITAGASELRFLCCCAPAYSHADTFFE